MRILVLGGTRFIGLATVRRLHQLGHEVAVFNRGRAPGELPAGVARFAGDVDRLADARAMVAGWHPEVVLHNIVIHERHGRDLVDVFRGVARRLVMVSSCDVYRAYGRLTGSEPGPPDPVPLDEEAPLREVAYPYRQSYPDPGHRLYDYDKIPAERAVLGAGDLPGTILRLPMVLGPNDYQHRLYAFARPMADTRAAIVLQDDYARWRSTYGYVDNVAAAIALAVTDERAAGRVYNVADAPLSTLALAERVGAALGWSGRIVLVPRADLPETMREEMDTRQDLVCSSERIRRELGLVDPVGLEEAIRRTIAWELENPPATPPPALDYAAVDAVLAAPGLNRPNV